VVYFHVSVCSFELAVCFVLSYNLISYFSMTNDYGLWTIDYGLPEVYYFYMLR